MPNYIFVTGGVLSGLGKGIVSASIGKLLQFRNYSVTVIKIDGYLNFDAGTLRPTEHGEVWVTEDGGEIDQDLGHYERFLNISISKENNMTSGQIFWQVISNEREGKYLGKTVQLIPHVTEEIKRRIRAVADKTKADFIIVEIGGTVGDYENQLFIEAARQMRFDGDRCVYVHVSYLPVPKYLGEQKSKPTQHSVQKLRELGIIADFIVCRSEMPVDDVRKEKIALFCNVKKEDVISNPDIENIYEMPLLFEDQNFGKNLLGKFGLERQPTEELDKWKKIIDRIKNNGKKIKVGIVGKYFDTGDFTLRDSYVSVIEAVKHAAWHSGANAEIVWFDSKAFEQDAEKLRILDCVDGVIVPGGFGASGVEGKIAAIKYCRENDIPYLGLCLGLQLAVVEFARNVCGMEDAHSTEINSCTKNPVIDLLPWQKEILEKSKYGATMRLGGQSVKIKEGTIAYELYGKSETLERFRHRFEISPDYVSILENKGFIFSGKSSKEEIMQIGELKNHPFFVGSQFHPEFTSRFERPNPLFLGFINACLKII